MMSSGRDMKSKVGKLPETVLDKLSTKTSRFWFHIMEQNLDFYGVGNMTHIIFTGQKPIGTQDYGAGFGKYMCS